MAWNTMGETKYMEDYKWKTQDTAQEEPGQDQVNLDHVCPVTEMLSWEGRGEQTVDRALKECPLW